jgi:hypothetical protein
MATRILSLAAMIKLARNGDADSELSCGEKKLWLLEHVPLCAPYTRNGLLLALHVIAGAMAVSQWAMDDAT